MQRFFSPWITGCPVVAYPKYSVPVPSGGAVHWNCTSIRSALAALLWVIPLCVQKRLELATASKIYGYLTKLTFAGVHELVRVNISLSIIANGAFVKKLSSAANRARTKNPRNVTPPIRLKVTEDCECECEKDNI